MRRILFLYQFKKSKESFPMNKVYPEQKKNRLSPKEPPVHNTEYLPPESRFHVTPCY